MTTRNEFLAKLRLKLNDPTAKRWSDLELEDYLDTSTMEYSKVFPQTREVWFSGNGLDNRFDVPEDLLDNWITQLWFILSNGTIYEVNGMVTRLRKPERSWEVVGQELVLNFIPAINQQVRIRYQAIYTIPVTGESLIPREDEDVIYIYAEYLAWRKVAGSDASLSRWDENGKRDDSPIIPQYVHLEREWHKMIDRKKNRGGFLVRARGQRYGRSYYNENL